MCADFYAPLLLTHMNSYVRSYVCVCVFVFFATRPCIQVNNSGHSLSQCLQIIMAFMTLVCTHISISIYICCTLFLSLLLSLSCSLSLGQCVCECECGCVLQGRLLLWGILFIIILFAPLAHLQQGSAHQSAFRFLRCSCFFCGA